MATSQTGITLQKIAFLNFGGIGDEILFSPVITAVNAAYPESHTTLILESRSGRIKELLPEIDSTVELDVQGHSRLKVFWRLLKLLRRRQFDAVISSGSSPFIAVLLALSGIPITVGFNSGSLSQKLLTAAAPLDRQIYAGDMYFSLAKTFLTLLNPQTAFFEPAIPKLSVPAESRATARQVLSNHSPHIFVNNPGVKRILIHPGVSRISIAKNILKAWPLSHWQQLLETLPVQYPDALVYLLGGPDDAEVLAEMAAFCETLPPDSQAKIINLNGQTKSLKGLAGLLVEGDVLISVDSAPLHLALGLGVPVVAIFGPTDAKKLVPSIPIARVVTRDDISCRPCLWDSRQTSCINPMCLDVTVDAVLAAISKTLAST